MNETPARVAVIVSAHVHANLASTLKQASTALACMQAISYCSRGCQQNHWLENHRQQCRKTSSSMHSTTDTDPAGPYLDAPVTTRPEQSALKLYGKRRYATKALHAAIMVATRMKAHHCNGHYQSFAVLRADSMQQNAHFQQMHAICLISHPHTCSSLRASLSECWHSNKAVEDL